MPSPTRRRAPSTSGRGSANSADPRRWPVRRAVSAGGVVTKDGSIAMIRVRSLKGRVIWALPKGGLEPGETSEQAAVREVFEETGLEAEIIEHLEDSIYWFAWPPERVRYRKTVHFFLMRATGGDIARHDDEVEAVEWVPFAQAAKRASYSSERRILRRAVEQLEA